MKTNKRQFFFDAVERELLRSALEFWSARITYETSATQPAHIKCGVFTQARIAEMLLRLKDSPQKGKS